MASPKRKGAGALSELVHFQKRGEVVDEWGNVQTGPWTTQFTEACRMMAKLGSEPVFAARLESRQPFIMTVRSSDRTRGVAMDWRAVNARTGAVYNLTTSVNVDERGAYLEMLVIDSGERV